MGGLWGGGGGAPKDPLSAAPHSSGLRPGSQGGWTRARARARACSGTVRPRSAEGRIRAACGYLLLPQGH